MRSRRSPVKNKEILLAANPRHNFGTSVMERIMQSARLPFDRFQVQGAQLRSKALAPRGRAIALCKNAGRINRLTFSISQATEIR